ncbi:MAG: hypothetical protein JNL98_16405 [Bryobacterales bacterium]|nr:hypothetical protein [Bryobacterales bacterium]
MFRLTADKITQIFGVRKHKRLRGKLHSMLEKLDHGHHVLRMYCKSLVARMYEKFSTFLRLEICVNRLKDLGLNKGLDNLNALGQKLVAATDRMAGFEAELLNVHVDFPLFQRLALPIPSGRTTIPGIKIQDTRMMRLMEVLLHGGTQLNGWRTKQIHDSHPERVWSLHRRSAGRLIIPVGQSPRCGLVSNLSPKSLYLNSWSELGDPLEASNGRRAGLHG